MAYVIVNHKNPQRRQVVYKTKAAARAALTRLRNASRNPLGPEWEVEKLDDYINNLPMKTVINLMTRKPIQIPADTPLSCDPSSETYWSM